ncbi:MAG: hypothetical protein ABJG78_01735 [Cyclobacteriaceae bacterium]
MRTSKIISILSVVVGFGLIFLTSCSNERGAAVDLQSAREEILELHNNSRKYHFEKDSISFANQLSKRFVSVNRGEVNRPSFDDNLKRFNRYFSSVEFVKWDDIVEPVIKFSGDGKMAYTIVQKEVVVRFTEDSKEMEEQVEFAWVAIYTKGEKGWKVECVASTNKESIVKDVDQD